MVKTQASNLPAKVTSFKYGMPVYGLAWPEGQNFYICGGGGSGIKNRLVIAEANQGILTDQVAEYNFGASCPMRLLLAPDGRCLVFAVAGKGIKRLDLDTKGSHPKASDVSGAQQERLQQVKVDVKSMAFSPDGDMLALGGEDRSLWVYEWPSLKILLELSGDKALAAPVVDIDFSRGKDMSAVAAVLDNGTMELWDWKQGVVLCKLARPKSPQVKSSNALLLSSPKHTMVQQLPTGMEGAHFSRLKYARDGSGRLFTLLNSPSGCFVAVWVQSTGPSDPVGMMSLSSTFKATEQSAACFDVSADGSKVALGTSEGTVVVLRSRPFAVLRKTPKCHMVFTTAITFSHDAKYVLSASADASVTVTETTLQRSSTKRLLSVIFFFICILMTLLLQFFRVMKDNYGMTPNWEWIRWKLGIDNVLSHVGL